MQILPYFYTQILLYLYANTSAQISRILLYADTSILYSYADTSISTRSFSRFFYAVSAQENLTLRAHSQTVLYNSG